jgi:hypothetical protein
MEKEKRRCRRRRVLGEGAGEFWRSGAKPVQLL